MKEIRTHGIPAHQAIDYFLARLHAIHKCNRIVAGPYARPDLRKRRGFDSGQNAQPIQKRLIEANDFRVGVEALRRSHAEDEQPFGA